MILAFPNFMPAFKIIIDFDNFVPNFEFILQIKIKTKYLISCRMFRVIFFSYYHNTFILFSLP